ncbi:MAG: pyridoxal phosphate-dependent aminotransferase [Candidatus Omnitrophica bacterium]|nr:pyridoxal phosphate-dependent aminotransferase [Candidatus Omnitrophota bacterium]
MSLYPFAKRINWSLENNPLSLAIEKMRSDGTPILDLTESNPTRCGFQYPKNWLEELSSSEALTYAPESKGTIKARRAVESYYQQRQYALSPEHLVLTSGTSEGYSFLLKLLTNPGDHVLIPKPSYPLFQFLIELHDVGFDYYPMVYEEGRWQIDREAFLDLVTSKTRAVILVNPNNPTCSYISKDDLTFLNEQCASHQMAIISDEVFLDYQLKKDLPAVSLVENTKVLTFVLSGISKVLGLPQMKLSWIAANGPKKTLQEALERLEIIADTYLSVNTPVQNSLASWLPQASQIQGQILQRVQANLETLRHYPLKVLSVEGGWYAIIDVPSLYSEEDFILDVLRTEQVLVHPGYFFDFDREGYLILSLLPQGEVFREAIERISRKIQNL